MRPPDPTPLLQPHYRAFVAHTSRPVPVLRLGTLASRFWPLGLSPFTSERLVPAVPCNRLHPLHALYTPATTCSVIRHPAGLSQKNYSPLVLTALDFLTTRPQGFTFVRLSDAHLHEFSSRFSPNAHYHGSSPQQLGGALRPAPESRSQGAHPHRLH